MPEARKSPSTALITGASSGIGRTLATKLAAEGVHVVVAARRLELLAELAAEITSAGGRATTLALDVSDAARVEAEVRALDERVGGLDLVIANAGMGRECWSGKLTWDRCAGTIAVNVSGAVATLVAALPAMVERGHGHIVGISSLAQYRGLPSNAVYAASKAFLSTFLEGVRIDLQGTGVAVTDVRPGFVRTPMTASNKGPMPWLLEPEAAADHVLRGLKNREDVVAFPWQLASVVQAASLLPNALYDRAVGRARRRPPASKPPRTERP